MARIVILGAGLTGISAAYHLEKKQFTDYKLFEKEPTIGGLCRSVRQDGFTFDFTGHLLHTSDPYFRHLIESVVGLENLNSINRRSFIYSHGIYTKYPYQINLQGLPDTVIAECIDGFVKRKKSLKKTTTFTQWVMKNFGAGFGKHFFFPYQEKLFSYDINQLSSSWTGRFVPSTSLEQIIHGITNAHTEEPVGYNAQFLYPKTGGIQFWVEKFAMQLQQPVQTDCCVQSIDLRQKTITFTNGHIEKYQQLITTLPLDQLLHLIKDTPSLHLKSAHNKLLCNSVVNFNIGVNHPNLSDKHWIYYPEKEYPFYRIGFGHNFSSGMTPPNCSSLYGEFSHLNSSPEEIHRTLKESLRLTKKLFNISESDILTEKIIHINHAYVIYNLEREQVVEKLLKNLADRDVYCVGRYAEWKYASMQEAVLDGKKIAEELLITPLHRAHYQQTPSFIPTTRTPQITV